MTILMRLSSALAAALSHFRAWRQILNIDFVKTPNRLVRTMASRSLVLMLAIAGGLFACYIASPPEPKPWLGNWIPIDSPTETSAPTKEGSTTISTALGITLVKSGNWYEQYHLINGEARERAVFRLDQPRNDVYVAKKKLPKTTTPSPFTSMEVLEDGNTLILEAEGVAPTGRNAMRVTYDVIESGKVLVVAAKREINGMAQPIDKRWFRKDPNF